MLYYLNKSRAMNKLAARAGFPLVKLPANMGSRQSINVQLPTAILKNLPAYLAYVDGIRAEVSELSKFITTVWHGLRDRHVLSALRARSFVDVVFTTPIVFFRHHRLVTRPVVRTIMDSAQAFIEEELAMLPEVGLAADPQLETTKRPSFGGCARRALQRRRLRRSKRPKTGGGRAPSQS
jgi:hypothetical protein